MTTKREVEGTDGEGGPPSSAVQKRCLSRQRVLLLRVLRKRGRGRKVAVARPPRLLRLRSSRRAQPVLLLILKLLDLSPSC